MDKELVIVDTSVFIDYFRKLRKDKSLLVELSQKYTLAISVVTKFELMVGIKDEIQRAFWKNLFNDIITFPFTEKEAEQAASLVQYLRQANKMIELPDIFIAATALENRKAVATLNYKDFARIPNLTLLNHTL